METMLLNGKWQFRQEGSETRYEGNAPSSQYADLLALGKIPDPFVGTNESEVRWAAECGWIYERTFQLTAEQAATRHVELVFEMIDTIATITLNGVEILKADNINRTYAIDVKPYVRVGENQLSVDFESPLKRLQELREKEGKTFNTNGEKGAGLMRKTQCHFGWDWGPVLPTVGLCRNTYLRFYETARIAELAFNQTHSANKVVLRAKCGFEGVVPDGATVRFELYSPKGERQAESIVPAALAECEFTIENPELWWTRDLSQTDLQPLYVVSAELSTEVGAVRKRIGLRTIELDRGTDEFGRQFRFKVNGVPIFVKGANWIPADSLITRLTDDKLDYLLRAVCDASQNMIRVWGGGFYEDDAFYDKCDQYGLLIWQDFAFACALYPFYHEEFLDTVQHEIEDNVKRLRHHASLALWCGNNEIEMCIGGVSKMFPLYTEWTEKFFHHILPDQLKDLDNVTPYIPGSPCASGFMQDVNNHSDGDVHLWAVWHGLQPLTFYRKKHSRFCSEFGMESLPDEKTIQYFAKPQDMNMKSDVFMAHQKCNSGNDKIQYYISTRFRLPERFEDLIYLSQIVQSECIRDATEHWRRNRGRCNGAIYWQLNDCWPVLSWAGIDYFGRYKALQYMSKKFSEPLTISVYEDNKKTKITLINDTLKSFDGKVRCRLEDFFGKVAFEKELSVSIGATNAKKIDEFDFSNLLKSVKRNAVFIAELCDDAGNKITEKTLLYAPEKKLSMPNAKFDISVERKEDKAVITVKSDRYARYVRLALADSYKPFTDNYFDLPAGRSKTVEIKLDCERNDEQLLRDLTVACANVIKPKQSKLRDGIFRMKIRLKPINLINIIYYSILNR